MLPGELFCNENARKELLVSMNDYQYMSVTVILKRITNFISCVHSSQCSFLNASYLTEKPPQQVHQQVVLAAKLARIVLERIDKC